MPFFVVLGRKSPASRVGRKKEASGPHPIALLISPQEKGGEKKKRGPGAIAGGGEKKKRGKGPLPSSSRRNPLKLDHESLSHKKKPNMLIREGKRKRGEKKIKKRFGSGRF